LARVLTTDAIAGCAAEVAAAAAGGVASAAGAEGTGEAADDAVVEIDTRKVLALLKENFSTEVLEKAVAEAKGAREAAGEGSHGGVFGGEEVGLLAAAHDEKGSRGYMEDKWSVQLDIDAWATPDASPDAEPTHFFGVFDGHTGRLAAEYTRTHLAVNIAQHPLFATDLVTAITESYLETDRRFMRIAMRDSLRDGSTVVTLVVRGTQAIIHWCGDSEAVLCMGGQASAMGEKHSPARDDEKERIKAAGGTVVWFGTWRVNGTLGVARSLGDKDHAGQVIADPDHRVVEMDKDTAFVVLASDGLFEVLDHDEVSNLSRWWIQTRERNDVARFLVGEALRRRSKDNLSAVVIMNLAATMPKGLPPRPDGPSPPTKAPVKPSIAALDDAKAAAEGDKDE
jgi:serine/threonine protein phosphatase PrpC